MHIPVGTIVEVQWLDSMRHSGWNGMDRIVEDIKKESMHHRTVGLVVSSDDRCIALAHSWHEERYSVSDVLQIPVQAVFGFRILVDEPKGGS